MKQCLSPEIWTALLEGGLPVDERKQAESHFASCSHCRLMANELVHVEDLLAGARSEAQVASEMDTAQIAIALNRFHQRVQQSRGILCCMDALRFFLSGMLGASAGAMVIQSAAQNQEVTDSLWPQFVDRLSDIVSDLCGDGAGAIVSYIGKLSLPGTA